MKKTLRLITVLLLMAGNVFSCADKDKINPDPFGLGEETVVTNPQEVIVGMWRIIADAYSEKEINGPFSIPFEFLPDGSWNQYLIYDVSQQVVMWNGTYTIDPYYFLFTFESGAELRFIYGFYENGAKLKLVRFNFITPRPVELLFKNYTIFQRID